MTPVDSLKIPEKVRYVISSNKYRPKFNIGDYVRNAVNVKKKTSIKMES